MIDSSVATLCVSDPGSGHRLDAEQRAELRSELKGMRKSGARALHLQVAGDAWDQSPLADAGELLAREVADHFHALVLDVFSLEIPVLVHLEGRVSGLGFGLVLACDVRSATPEATLGMGAPETPAALVSGSPWLVSHRIGSAVAADLSWTGRRLTADEALKLGLLSEVSAEGTAVTELAQRLARLGPGSTSSLKRSLHARLVPEFKAQLEYDAWLATVSARSSS